MSRIFYLFVFIVLLQSCTPSNKTDKELDSRPNYLIIYTDDLGYADIAPFNDQIKYATPNLSVMAEEGMKFTSMYASSPACSPSRASLLTGRQPFKMGINAVFYPSSWTGLPTSETTLAEILQENGYSTGMSGKWHLGHRQEYLPLQRGFDEFFGIAYSNGMETLGYIEGNEIVGYDIDQALFTKKFTERTLDFLERHQDEPFFYYLAHPMPHVPLYASKDFEGKSGEGIYADVIQELDWSVGAITNKLKELNLDEKTIVIFTSDNGPWLSFGPEGGNADPLREGKLYTFEGGMRVPFIIRWPGKIKPNTRYDGLATQMDLFPTFLNLAGIQSTQFDLDGEDITPVLLQQANRKGDEIIYNEWGEFVGIRKGDWKMKLPYKGNEQTIARRYVPAHDTLLFNLNEDIGETNDLSSEYPEKVKELAVLLEERVKSYGELPPPLVVLKPADKSHIDKNKKRLGIN